MIKKLEQLINNSPFYNVIRYNVITDNIMEAKNKITDQNISFYSSFLGDELEEKVVFDIGANKGHKIKAFLKMGMKVIALEPEKKAIETIKWRFENNSKLKLVQKGVSDKEGQLDIYVADARSGLNTLSSKWAKEDAQKYTVEVTTLDQLMGAHSVPHFIKIDVEGFEEKVIRGMNTAPNYLSFESNLPEFLSETEQIIGLLEERFPGVSFNYSFTEKLVNNEWIDKAALLKIVRDRSIKYLEVICKFQ